MTSSVKSLSEGRATRSQLCRLEVLRQGISKAGFLHYSVSYSAHIKQFPYTGGERIVHMADQVLVLTTITFYGKILNKKSHSYFPSYHGDRAHEKRVLKTRKGGRITPGWGTCP